jgi:hypothetical protein
MCLDFAFRRVVFQNIEDPQPENWVYAWASFSIFVPSGHQMWPARESPSKVNVDFPSERHLHYFDYFPATFDDTISVPSGKLTVCC